MRPSLEPWASFFTPDTEVLTLLDQKMTLKHEPATILIVGGGGSMILQYDYKGSTVDIDAVPLNSEFENLKPYMEEVARELKIVADWLNPYYQAFTHYLPADSKKRFDDQLTFLKRLHPDLAKKALNLWMT